MTTLITGTMSAVAPFPHTIVHGAHTNPVGNDITIYYTGSTQKVFYSFSDDTDWDVGVYNVVADTFDDDFMSTVPATPLASPYLTGGKGFPHPMIVGDDDVLYIGDRNFVHAYDGALDKFFPAVLTLPQGYIITCFTTTEDINLAIGAYLLSANADPNNFNRGTAKVWFWNYLALDPNYARDLRDNYVSELIQWGGTTAAFTMGRRTLSDKGQYKLQALNGSQFEVIKTWSTGGYPIRGGVDNVANDLYWNSSGAIYAYTRRPDTGQYMFNIISNTPSGTSGMLRFLTASNIIHFSWGAGAGNGGLQYLNALFTSDGLLICQVAAPVFSVREKGRLKSITIAFADTFTGGRTIEVLTYLDRVSSSTTSTIAASTKTRYVQFTTAADGSPLGDFNTLQLQLNWAVGAGNTVSPIAEWVEYEFEIVNVVNGV